MRYWALQIPGTVLVAAALYWLWPRMEWPWWTAGAVLVGWVVKDAILYPLTKDAYAGAGATGGAALVGSRAVVTRPLEPQGAVRIQGETWRAVRADESESATAPVAGEEVLVTGVRGLILEVRRPDEDG